MVLTHPGIENGVFYYLSNPTSEGGLVNILQTLCVGLSTFIGISLFVCHFSRLCYLFKNAKTEQNMDENGIYIQDIFPSKNDKHKLGISYYYIWSYHILTITAIIFCFGNLVNGVIYEILWSSKLIVTCRWSLLTSTLTWNAVKFCIYCMCILRIFNTFHGSYLDYSNKIKISVFVYLVASITFIVLHAGFLSQGYDIKENGVFKWCQFGSNVISLAITGVFEGTMNLLLLALFVKPAMVLSKNSENKPEMILNATAKVALLMSFVITTSLLVVVFMWFGLIALLYFDIVINVACMLLMQKTNEIFYQKCCHRCHNKIYKCCVNYIDKQRNKNKQTSSNKTIEI